jgi:hypothetical protein
MSELELRPPVDIYKEFFDQLDRAGQVLNLLQEALESALHRRKYLSKTDKILCQIMSRITKTSSAIRILSYNGFTEDSQPLLRNLLETTIIANWIIQRSSKERLKRIKDKEKILAFKRLKEYKGYLERQFAGTPTKSIKRELKELDALIQKAIPLIKTIESNYGINIKKDSPAGDPICPSVAKMARDTKFELPRITQFWISTQFVHFSLLSLESFFHQEDDLLDFGSKQNWKMIPDIVISTTFFVLQFARIFNTHFGLKMGKIILQQRSNFAKFMKTYNKQRKPK